MFIFATKVFHTKATIQLLCVPAFIYKNYNFLQKGKFKPIFEAVSQMQYHMYNHAIE